MDGGIGKEEAYSRLIFYAYWVDGKDLSQHEVLSGLVEKLGVNSSDFIEGVSLEKTKQAFKNNTVKALNKGVFGVLTFL